MEGGGVCKGHKKRAGPGYMASTNRLDGVENCLVLEDPPQDSHGSSNDGAIIKRLKRLTQLHEVCGGGKEESVQEEREREWIT
jgi:hypothetical protein